MTLNRSQTDIFSRELARARQHHFTKKIIWMRVEMLEHNNNNTIIDISTKNVLLGHCRVHIAHISLKCFWWNLIVGLKGQKLMMTIQYTQRR